MNAILPFTSTLSGASRFSPFMAIQFTMDKPFMNAPDGGQFHELSRHPQLLSITPRVMIWSQETYILDMTPVMSYWNHRAEQQGESFCEFLQTLLNSLCSTDERLIVAISDHPWKALLALLVVDERPTLNYIDTQSHLGRRILQDLSWAQWLTRCRELRDHKQALSQKIGSKKSRPLSLTSLVKTIDRLHLRRLNEMLDVDASSMRRRFGEFVAVAWEWTWDSSKSSTFKDSFPWRGVEIKEKPVVARVLDTPLSNWDHIEPFLCEDLDNICKLSCFSSSERVVSLEWRLSFSCLPPLRIPVLFRHPHSLHRETGHHKTALLQAFYAWTAATSRQNSSPHPNQLYLADDQICEWTLEVHERLTLAPQLRSLFNDDLSTESSQLVVIENSLPIPLVSYRLSDQWDPERAYKAACEMTCEIASGQDDETPELHDLAKLAMHQRRPLFIYDTPQTLPHRYRSSGLIFCERVATSWWSSDKPRQVCRDYYIRITDDGLLQWVFRNDDGIFYLNGLYG